MLNKQVQQKLDLADFDNINWDEWNANLLSSVSMDMELSLSEVDELIKAVSETKRPYQQMLEYIYGEVPEFPKLLEIQVPSDFSVPMAIQEINKHMKLVNDQVLEAFSKSEIVTAADLDYTGFKTSRHGEEIVNVPKMKAYIELVELVTQADTLWSEDSLEQITNILLYKCYEMCRL